MARIIVAVELAVEVEAPNVFDAVPMVNAVFIRCGVPAELAEVGGSVPRLQYELLDHGTED